MSERVIRLADTTVRMYRRKDGLVSFRVKGYLMLCSGVSFSLTAYLKWIMFELTLPSGDVVPMEVSVSERREAPHLLDTLVHGFSAQGTGLVAEMRNTVGTLRIHYHFEFTGHPVEGRDHFDVIVPVIVRTCTYKGL